jgi:hypothetical protein
MDLLAHLLAAEAADGATASDAPPSVNAQLNIPSVRRRVLAFIYFLLRLSGSSLNLDGDPVGIDG